MSIRAEKLSAEEARALAGAGSRKLDILAAWSNKQLTCTHCGTCTGRCEVLQGPGIDIGFVEEQYRRIAALEGDTLREALIDFVNSRPDVYHALRQCCFCGHCTAFCEHHVLAADRMRDWRELFCQVGYMPPDDSKIVMVDNEWHIFSAYRAIYGIGYPEFPSLAQAVEAGPGEADTVFFPGCSLVSYAPELTRKIGAWLTAAGVKWVLSQDCCGSSLMSAGMFDRAKALRTRICQQAKEAGITRLITVCPGCGEELAHEAAEAGIEIVPLPEVLLHHARRLEAQGVAFGGLSPLDVESYTVADSCHDRADNRHGTAIRQLLRRYIPQAQRREMAYCKTGTLCCGAGGAVSSYDPDITNRRIWRLIDNARDTKAQMLVTMCPTCTYTVGQACLGADPQRGIESHNYLELLFGETIDWKRVFAELEGMWSGEYAAWLMQTFC